MALITQGLAIPRMKKLKSEPFVSEIVSVFNPCPETHYLAQERGELTILLAEASQMLGL